MCIFMKPRGVLSTGGELLLLLLVPPNDGFLLFRPLLQPGVTGELRVHAGAHEVQTSLNRSRRILEAGRLL